MGECCLWESLALGYVIEPELMCMNERHTLRTRVEHRFSQVYFAEMTFHAVHVLLGNCVCWGGGGKRTLRIIDRLVGGESA